MQEKRRIENDYHKELLKTLQKIYIKNEDPTLHKNLQKIETESIENEVKDEHLLSQEEILFMQYPLEKKGKNFNTTQTRTFKIDDGKLLQIDKNNTQKQLPPPTIVTFHQKDPTSKEEWSKNYSQYLFKLELQFEKRTPISIYFKDLSQAKQIYAFVLSKNQHHLSTLKGLHSIFKAKLAHTFSSKFTKVKKNTNYAEVEKKKRKAIERLKQVFNRKNQMKYLIYEWQKKSLKFSEPVDVAIELFSLSSEFSLTDGRMKLWVGNQTLQQSIYCQNQEEDYRTYEVYETNFEKPNKFCLDNVQTNTVIQFQLQLPNTSKNPHLWRTQRFYLSDLLRVRNKSRKIVMNLHAANRKCRICFDIVNLNDISLNDFKIPKIAPTQFQIIQELYGNVQPKALDPTILKPYIQAYQQYQEFESTKSISFLNFRRLYDLLNVDGLIEKIYSTYPFNQYIGVSHKCTFFYCSLVKKAEKAKFYDVQKLVWKFKCDNLHRFLSAFKSFDETPRINFTQPFFHVCQRCIEVAMNESTIKWKSQLFDDTIIGRQSMAFFLVLGLLRQGSSLFLQQQKKAVSVNSLLFHFALKNEFSSLYQKILKTQLNIEAFFGQQSVSLFGRLLGSECFFMVLQIFSQQNKQGQQTHFSLIGIMLALMHMIDEFHSPYLSAQHYMAFFKHFCQQILHKKLTLFQLRIEKYRKVALECSKREEYKVMKESLEHFHMQNAYDGQLGEITQQLYDEFMCYHFKREADIRKIFMVIDHIDLGAEVTAISVSLHQNHQKIYEHEFNGINLDELHHPIEFKLLRLDTITILINHKTSSSQLMAYRCELDPKSFPSNYYFQFVEELTPLKLLPHRTRCIGFQVYIKDSCEVEYLENYIPQKYVSHLLLSELARSQALKEDVVFCNSYVKNFRMKENNLNLLYGKLGWYGNHYLIPEQKITQIFKEQRDKLISMNADDERRLSTLMHYSRCLFGKCILPVNHVRANQHTKFHTQAYKGDMIVSHQTTKHQMKQYLQYTSTNNLLTYTLDNFHLPLSMNFLQFYYKITQSLPLLGYLGYQTLQFYTLPSVYFTIAHENQKCRIVMSENGRKVQESYPTQKIKILQIWAQKHFSLPQTIEYQYYHKNLYLDQFLYLLRLNVIEYAYNNKKQQSPKKSSPLLPTLVSKHLYIPNFQLYHLYCILNETDIDLEFEFGKGSMKRLAKTQQYNDYAYINGKWRCVSILLKLESPNNKFYYVEMQQNRKKHIMREFNMIEGITQTEKGELQFAEIETFKFTDKELEEVKECVVSELIKYG